MQNSATFQRFAGHFGVAMALGLGAAAETYRSALAAKLARGYTTGRFTTGDAAGSLKIGQAGTIDGVPAISVSTADFKQRIWEFGAFNAFTRRYERKEYWRETLLEEGAVMSLAFHRAFTQALGA